MNNAIFLYDDIGLDDTDPFYSKLYCFTCKVEGTITVDRNHEDTIRLISDNVEEALIEESLKKYDFGIVEDVEVKSVSIYKNNHCTADITGTLTIEVAANDLEVAKVRLYNYFNPDSRVNKPSINNDYNERFRNFCNVKLSDDFKELDDKLKEVRDYKGFEYNVVVSDDFNIGNFSFYKNCEYLISTYKFNEFFIENLTDGSVCNISEQEAQKLFSSERMYFKDACFEAVKQFNKFTDSNPEYIKAYGELASEYGIVYRIPDGEETIKGLWDAESSYIDNTVEIRYGNNLIDEDLNYFSYIINVEFDETEDDYSIVYAARTYENGLSDIVADFTESQMGIICDAAIQIREETLEQEKEKQKAKAIKEERQ